MENDVSRACRPRDLGGPTRGSLRGRRRGERRAMARLSARTRSTLPAAELRGAVLTRFLDWATASCVAKHRGRFARVTGGRMCAGVDYPDLIEDALDFVLYRRTLPWDHAPDVPIAQQAGCYVRRPDHCAYRADQTTAGLLA